MTIAIMQPYLLPYIGYWQLINAVDTFVIFDDVNFIKKGYINRNRILVNGQARLFTVDLIGASQNKLINEIEVGNKTKKILRTIELSYSKAPYFNVGFPIIKEIFNQKEKKLAKFVGYSLQKISNYLEIDTKFIYSSRVEKNNNLKAQDKILDICKRLQATNYINSIGGQGLYNKNNFLEKNIILSFLETGITEYKQFNSNFVPCLSIIDIIMFNCVEEIQNMLNNYKLI